MKLVSATDKRLECWKAGRVIGPNLALPDLVPQQWNIKWSPNQPEPYMVRFHQGWVDLRQLVQDQNADRANITWFNGEGRFVYKYKYFTLAHDAYG